jgi:hypothetical protein
MRKDGCFRVLLLISVLGLLAYFLSDRTPPVGPSCYDRFKSLQEHGERYPGERDQALEDCSER